MKVSMNMLDRMISWISPRAGAQRMFARMSMAAASGRITNVRNAAGGREGTMGNWHPRRLHRHEEQLSFFKAMERAESLLANDGHAVSAIDALALNIVGGGLKPQSYPDCATLGISEDEGAAFAESMERAWKFWSEEADAGAVLSFEDIQYQAMRSMLTTGEILHLSAWREDGNRLFSRCTLPASVPRRTRPATTPFRTALNSAATGSRSPTG